MNGNQLTFLPTLDSPWFNNSMSKPKRFIAAFDKAIRAKTATSRTPNNAEIKTIIKDELNAYSYQRNWLIPTLKPARYLFLNGNAIKKWKMAESNKKLAVIGKNGNSNNVSVTARTKPSPGTNSR